jgi:hypothetical protein
MNGVVTYQTVPVSNVVPEPTAATLVAVSLVAMVGRRRQRRWNPHIASFQAC